MLDSGASAHLSGLKDKLRNLKNDERGVKGADGKVFATHQSGEMVVRLPNGDTSTPVTLKDMLYHPNAPYTLISIGRMEAAGFTLTFKGGECRITPPDGDVIGIVPRVFYPYFADALGALDGTYIACEPPAVERESSRNRKGFLSQNCLIVVSFDLRILYVLCGWEGSAADVTVYNDARSVMSARKRLEFAMNNNVINNVIRQLPAMFY
jgi:hypothetical protein